METHTHNWLERTELLLGSEKLELLRNAHVLVVGLGGVGAYAAEMIARAGVGRMTVADADTVNATNINRQLVALHSTVGRPKAEVLAERLRDINPEIDLSVVNRYIRDEETESSTVSGWVMEQFGRLPETGASFDFETLHVTITRIANHHIEQIRVVTAVGNPAEAIPAS